MEPLCKVKLLNNQVDRMFVRIEKAALYHWTHRASTSLRADLAEQGSGREPQDPGTHRVHDKEFLIAPRTAPSSFVSVSGGDCRLLGGVHLWVQVDTYPECPPRKNGSHLRECRNGFNRFQPDAYQDLKLWADVSVARRHSATLR